MTNAFPRMMAVRQNFPAAPPLDIPAAVRGGFAGFPIPKGRIAVAAGSRGISNLDRIVAAVIEVLRAAGAAPFVVPAMGSHGGATPEGQRELLAGYGVSEERLGVPVKPSLDVERLGVSEDGVPVFLGAEAFRSDGIVVVNRVKPHTDFWGKLGSGIQKMIAIGLSKQAGAAACHRAASRLGYERVIRGVARVTLAKAPILCGVGIVENQVHETARIAVLPRGEIEARETELLEEATRLMPRLPFEEIDLLVVDRLGKNISGSGMDPNVIGRRVHGYSSSLAETPSVRPVIRRLFVRELTPESHGNAIGIGLADFTTTRLVRSIDRTNTYMNALTALSVQSSKIPIHFDTDREAVEAALATLALPDPRGARVARIRDTLSLGTLEASEAYEEAVRGRKDLAAPGPPAEMRFDSAGNLEPMS